MAGGRWGERGAGGIGKEVRKGGRVGEGRRELEVWNGCCRRIEREELICSLLEQWGNKSREVRLAVTSSYQYIKWRGDDQRTVLYRVQTHRKVAAKRQRGDKKRQFVPITCSSATCFP